MAARLAPRTGYGSAYHRDAGGAIIRGAIHALESLGYVERHSTGGRIISSAGMKKIDGVATEILKEMAVDEPTLGLYR